MLKQVVQHRSTGQIMPQDLPPECWMVSRRVLSPLYRRIHEYGIVTPAG